MVEECRTSELTERGDYWVFMPDIDEMRCDVFEKKSVCLLIDEYAY